MGALRRYRRPLVVVAAATVLDLLARVGFGFDMEYVVPAEAALFLVAAVLFAFFGRAPDAADPGVRRLDRWLAALFALASLRSALWAAGLDVYVANMVILIVGAVAGGSIWIRSRRRTARKG